MKVWDCNILLHSYYGSRVTDGDLSYLLRRKDRGFSPNPSEAGLDRTFSLDTFPREYSTSGVGDFRLPSIELELPNGSRSCDLRYVDCQVRPGKYALEGLPALHGSDEEWETLSVTLIDAAAQVWRWRLLRTQPPPGHGAVRHGRRLVRCAAALAAECFAEDGNII